MSSQPKYYPLVLTALAQSYASPGEMPLHTTRAQPGLFPTTGIGKAAAQAALQSNWLQSVRSETKGKAITTYVTLTTTGSDFLLEQTDPKPLLEQVQTRLQSEASRLQEVQSMVRVAFQSMEALKNRVEKLATMVDQRQVVQARVSVPAWEDRLTEYLNQRESARPAEDCPLPELYQQARQIVPELSVGTFHDGLRRLHADRRIALQPWTGPLHELPEPSLALLQGHSLAFYASSQG
ncbi:MAG TPA: hypothetical protein PLN21_14335 [Gemmatales bacterium]|nr:hypothetical protein [Gemmatales bacterium]